MQEVDIQSSFFKHLSKHTNALSYENLITRLISLKLEMNKNRILLIKLSFVT